MACELTRPISPSSIKPFMRFLGDAGMNHRNARLAILQQEQHLSSAVVGHRLSGTAHSGVILQYLFTSRTPPVWCAPSMSASKPSEIIDRQIAALTDWRGKTLANLRKVIHDADPEIVEGLKWLGTPCWSHDGIICVAAPFKGKVKLTFIHGASLPDPDKVFNAGLEGKEWRAIDLYEDDIVNERALRGIVRAAVAHNRAGLKEKTPASARGIRRKARKE